MALFKISRRVVKQFLQYFRQYSFSFDNYSYLTLLYLTFLLGPMLQPELNEVLYMFIYICLVMSFKGTRGQI